MAYPQTVMTIGNITYTTCSSSTINTSPSPPPFQHCPVPTPALRVHYPEYPPPRQRLVAPPDDQYSRLLVLHPVQSDHGGAAQADVVLETDLGAGHLPLLRLTADLRQGHRVRSGQVRLQDSNLPPLRLPADLRQDHRVKSGQDRSQIDITCG